MEEEASPQRPTREKRMKKTSHKHLLRQRCRLDTAEKDTLFKKKCVLLPLSKAELKSAQSARLHKASIAEEKACLESVV